MKIETKKVKLSTLKPNPNNPRMISKKDMDRLVKSLTDFPEMLEIREIVCDETMTVLGGNMRLQALKKAGAKECLAKIVSGLTDYQKREFVIKDNGSWGEWSMDDLANAWGDLPLVDWGVDLPEDWAGSSEDQETQDAEPQIDKAAELNKVWQVKSGDLWLIGEHRLLCGDSTKKEDVERVMGGERADAVVTDPPYGIDREGIPNDKAKDLPLLFEGCLSAIQAKNAVVMAFQSPKFLLAWVDAIRQQGHQFERLLWWRENGNAYPWRGFRMQGEAICVSSIGTPEWDDSQSHPDTFDDVNNHRDGHPTQKPVTLISSLLSHTKGLCYDPFLGSGTTMVACQNLNRKCRGIEISPDYCAVILQRMHDAFPEIEIRRINA